MRNLKLGFKLYSDEYGAFSDKAVEFIEMGNCSYIELFMNPGTMDCLQNWQDFKEKHKISFTLHAPHSVFNVNLADKTCFEFNKLVLAQSNAYAEALDAQYVVVHPGKLGDIKETVRQLNLINPKRMVIENKPYVSRKTMTKTYRGATIEEIEYVRKNHNCGFCLDISHSFSTANELGINPYEYLEKFQNLNPTCYHISGNTETSKIDLHTHFDKCNWDLERVFEIIDTSKNITLETRKDREKEFPAYLNDTKILQR